MFQDFYRFNIYIFMFTNEIRPYKSHADHRKQTSGEIDILPFMQKELVVEFLLSDFEGVEEPHVLILSPVEGLTGSNEKIILATRSRFKA